MCTVLAGCHQQMPLKNSSQKKIQNNCSQISTFLIFLSTKKLHQSRTAWLQQDSSNDIKEMIYAISGKENKNLG